MHPAADLSRRTVLVTGAAGQIGRVTTKHLADHGARVVALSLDGDEVEGAAVCIAGDACRVDDVKAALDGVDAVVHLAALAHRDVGTPYEVFGINVVATFTVLVAAAELGINRAVVASSINRWGLPLGVDDDAAPPYWPLDAQTPAQLSDWYSLSKYSDEVTCQMVAARWGMTIVSLRFPLTMPRERLERVARHLRDEPGDRAIEGWSYLDLRDAARAIEAGLTADVDGACAYYLAAPLTASPYPTEQLLDRFWPTVERRRRFEGREVPIDLTEVERDLGFTAIHLLDQPELSLEDPPPQE
ncbi:NAD-dependent epimerase/dehydratase family protein [Aestuariimicrobium ganziense]|uniref:NAD-dependent epimerase/dehydratase family protein n=1 Tax=Aestuariimicrobium ganziense TaxID=2773677 RepID=UPI001944E24D|nr:NAD(P)-dependent oxidoreductase [Aestuariimicrobium ganziense]